VVARPAREARRLIALSHTLVFCLFVGADLLGGYRGQQRERLSCGLAGSAWYTISC
jgi:hypothetical protein